MSEVSTIERALAGHAVPGDELHGLAIAVLQRGFVFVGQVSSDDGWVRIAGARSIIRWGTTKHLAQLANDGPQASTKLGAASDVKAPLGALIAILPVDAAKWKS